MRKAFMGVRLRRLREERNLKQVELAGHWEFPPAISTNSNRTSGR
ncbi:hypothetical protein [Sphingomonas sp. LH128]